MTFLDEKYIRGGGDLDEKRKFFNYYIYQCFQLIIIHSTMFECILRKL